MRKLIIHHTDTRISAQLLILHILIVFGIDTDRIPDQAVRSKIDPRAHMPAFLCQHPAQIPDADLLCQRIPERFHLPDQIPDSLTKSISRRTFDIQGNDPCAGNQNQHSTGHRRQNQGISPPESLSAPDIRNRYLIPLLLLISLTTRIHASSPCLIILLTPISPCRQRSPSPHGIYLPDGRSTDITFCRSTLLPADNGQPDAAVRPS